MRHDVDNRPVSRPNPRTKPAPSWRRRSAGFAQRILLCIASWPFDPGAWWIVARYARAIRRIPDCIPGLRGARAGLGVESSLDKVALRPPKTVDGRHCWIGDLLLRPRGQLTALGGRSGADDVCLVQAVPMKSWLLSLGLGGTGLAAICCLTPFLPWLFSLLGISGALGYVYRDDVLLPILAGFLLLTGYALWRRKRTK